METEDAWLAQYSPKELLLLVLAGMDIAVLSEDGNNVYVANEYIIEVEGASLYKLVHKGQVVAPFNDLIEMCNFIKIG
jgi:hypothetical protein